LFYRGQNTQEGDFTFQEPFNTSVTAIQSIETDEFELKRFGKGTNSKKKNH
jgi:hypothetical protein